MSTLRKLIIDIDDYQGVRTVFTLKKYKQKKQVHPELCSKTFLRNVVRVIVEPEQVWQDYNDRRNKRCYYRKYSVRSYVKVVIFVSNSLQQVVTAYEIDRIKENSYPDLKQLK
jgi:hypothetical protein